jgi:hypothetical protein
VINVSDIIMHQKFYFYDSPWWDYPIQNRAGRFDLNCDRRLDMRDLTYLLDMIFNPPLPACTCGTIHPQSFDDPGIPDTVWVESDTLIVGIPAAILVGVVNDEALPGFALDLEWEGSAVLGVDPDSSEFTPRIDSLFWNGKVRHALANGVNPDTFQFYGYKSETESISLPSGREAVISIAVTPQSPGTADFSLVTWRNGSPSMLAAEDHAAILPAFYGGHITVLPYLAGDGNHDGKIDIGDVIHLINYLYRNGPAPNPLESGDANCDTIVDVADVVFLINYLFKAGPAPSC